jgi:hypothetical protein
LLSSVETSLPTVVLGAKDENGQDLFAVRVLVDDAPLVGSLDGKAVALDPGPHVLRFEREDGRSSTLKVLIREAEKNRPISVTFERPKVEPPPPAPAVEAPHRSVLPYVLGGVGVVALGATLALTVDGQRRYDACKASPCGNDTVSGLSVERAVTFVTLGVGVVSVAAAAWLWISQPSTTSATSVAVGVGGNGVWAAGTF